MTAWTAVALLIWTAAALRRRRLAARPAAFWLPWLSWALISALASGQPLKSLPDLARWSTFAAFFALACTLEPRHRRWWVWGLCAAGPVLGLAALWTGWDVLLSHGSGEAMTGLLPRYYNYTMFALAAAGAAAFAAAGHTQALRGKGLAALWAVVAISGSLLVVARARAALIALLVGVVVAALRQGKAWRVGAVAAVLLVSTAGFTAFMMARGNPILHVLKLDKAQVFKRPELWKAALAVAADHPLLGEGPGQFENGFLRHNFPSRYRLTSYQFTTAFAHSEPLQIAAETGFAGLALWLMALAASVRLSGPRTLPREAALAAACAMATQGLVDNMLQVPALGLLFFSALACARPAEVADGPTAPRAWAWAAAVGLLLSAAAWTPRWLADSWAAEEGPPPRRLAAALKAAAVFPRDADRHEAAGRAWLQQVPPRGREALEAFETASRLSPTNALYIVWRAELLRANGRWEKVDALARQAVALEPNFLQARLLLAEAAARSGRLPQARAELAEVERRREELRAARLYVPDRSLYTGYDLLVGSFDEGRFAAVRRLVK